MGQDSSADGASRSGQDAQAQSSRESLSATGMFEAVVPEAMPDPPAAFAPAPVPVTPSPAVPVAAPPVPHPSPAPFNPGMPVVHEVVFPAQGAASSSDPFSLLSSLRTLGSDERVRAAELPPATVVQLREPVSPPATPEGGFTQLLRSLGDTPAPPPVVPPQPSPVPPPGRSPSALSFTKLMRALDAGSAASSGASVPPHEESSAALPVSSLEASASPSQSTRVMARVAPVEASAPVVPASTPPAGAFTQLFQALDQQVSSVSAQPNSAVAAPPAVSSAGSFTSLFRTAGPGSETPVAPSAEVLFVPKQEASPSDGSFTELFRAIDPATAAPAPSPLVPPPHTPSAPPAPSQSPGSFTQMFAAPSSTPASGAARDWGQTPQAEDKFAAPQYRAATPPPTDLPRPDSGSLTQLLRTLDQSDVVPQRPSAAPPAPPGAFTSIYAAREPIANQPERLSSPSAAPSGGYGSAAQGPPPESGPSDFTRILQASSMREQALQRGEQAAAPAVQAPPVAAPATPPQMPAFPGQIPQFPHPSALPPVNFGVGAVPPAAQPVKGMPALTPPPWMQPPTPPVPATPPVNKTQQLLPIVLIGIIFLLVIVLVAVVFLMKR